jgi:hypothetical protein
VLEQREAQERALARLRADGCPKARLLAAARAEGGYVFTFTPSGVADPWMLSHGQLLVTADDVRVLSAVDPLIRHSAAVPLA